MTTDVLDRNLTLESYVKVRYAYSQFILIVTPATLTGLSGDIPR